MYKPDNLIIDNNKLKLFEELKELNKILKEQNCIDIASAYFNIGGLQLIKDSLENIEKLRLLIGVVVQSEEDKFPDFFEPEKEYKTKLRKDLEKEKFEKEKKKPLFL